jgi:hypothetical protein
LKRIVLVCGVLFLSGGLSSTVRADFESDSQKLQTFRIKLKEQTAKDPAAATVMAQAFLRELGTAHPQITADAYGEVASHQEHHAKDYKGALTTVEAGLRILADSPQRLRLVAKQALILSTDGQGDAAQALLQANWPEVLKQDDFWLLYLPASSLSQVMEKSGKYDKLLPMLRQVAERGLLHDPFYEMMSAGLLRQGEEDEALSWAKARFQVCRFDQDEIKNATQLLMRTWAVSDIDGTLTEAFVKAQSEAGAPNPLAQVKAPPIPAARVQEALGRAGGAHDRITTMIIGGEWRRAMLEARRLTIDSPESPEGTLQICRVFKARDLNLLRANAYLEFLKTKGGTNPIKEFLQQNPATETQAETKTAAQ